MVASALSVSPGFLLTTQIAASWPWLLATATGCLVLGSIGVHTAAALLVYSPTKIERRYKNPRALRDLAQHQREYLLIAWTTALVGLAGALPLAALAADDWGWPLTAAFGVATGLLAAVLPVSLAHRRAETIVLWTLPFLRVCKTVLRYPLVLPLGAIVRGTLRALHISDKAPKAPQEIADEILAAVTDSTADGTLDQEERLWIENIVELKELHVSEAMTPRTDVVAFEATTDIATAVSTAIQTGHSRYPVYEDKVDNVVGVFYAKDALPRLGNDSCAKGPVREVMRKPLFVPESMGVIELLRQFRATKLQMAIVLDEYGGTAGLISIEDILEEIVGDMSDEFDTDEEEAIKVIEPNRLIELSGRVRVDELNEILKDAIPEDGEYDTVAGYVFTELGKIPCTGESVCIDGLEFEIVLADDRRIERMRVRRANPVPSQKPA